MTVVTRKGLRVTQAPEATADENSAPIRDP
jgi:hypothetical protein